MMKGLPWAYQTHITPMRATELLFLCTELDRHNLPADIQKDKYVWNANFLSWFVKIKIYL